MKKQLLLLLIAVLFLFQYSGAQSTGNYTRTSDATGSLYTMAGSVPLIGASQNSKSSELVEIGFDFYFMGARYTSFSVNSNGAMQLGTSIISTGYIGTSFPSANPIIAPFLGDLRTSSTGKVHCTNIGAYPNRKLVVEWMNMGVNSSSSTADATFQVVLTETTGVIQFIYGTVKIGSGTSATKTIVGFCNNTTANNVLSVAHSSPWSVSTGATPTSQTYNSTGATTSFSSTADGSRVDIYFTPPVRTAPVMLVNTATTTTSTTVNWTDLATNELGYVVYFSDDGGLSYTFYNQYAANTITSVVTPMLAGKAYIFKAFSLSEGALSGPITTSNATMSSCGSIATNTTTFTGTTANWSALTWSLGHVPTPCENAVVICNRATTGTETITITLDVDVAVNSLTLSNISPNTGIADRKYFNINGTVQVQIANDLVLSCSGGNKFNRCTYAVQEKTTVNGNVIMGSTTPIATEGYSSIGSNGNNPGQYYLLRGNMTYNKRAYTTDEHAVFTFDKNGTQFIYNNIPLGTADTLQALLFEKLNIGMSYSPTVILGGTGGQDGYIEAVSRGGIYVNNNATLVLPQNYSLNALGGSNYFKMMPGSTLKLGGDASVTDPFTGTAFGVPGSNFPGGFTSWVLDPTAVIEYNGSNAITQTIYGGVTYPKLVITNGSGTGRAQKITTAAVTVNDYTTINSGADVTLGAGWSNGGAYNVLTNGGLYCAANVVSGTGAFTLNNLGYLGIGHADGITSGTTTMGNIQMMGGRSFSTSGNYIYYGTLNQNTGNGLPATCNDLTVSNTAASGTVTLTPTTAQLVNGTHLISSGTFKVGTNKVTIGAAATMNATGTGQMEVDKGILEFAGTAGTAQTVDGSWFVRKTISTLIDNNTKGITVAATANDSLHIASALLYGTGITNSTITTNNNISLLSRDTATARFGEIVTGSGNTIVGNVNVERYLPTLRKWRHLAVPIGSNQTVRDAWMEKNTVANGNTKAGYGTIVTDDLATAVAQNFDSRSVSGPSVKYYNPVANNYTSITNPATFNINSQNSYYNFVRGDRSCTPANSNVATTILRTTGTLKTGNQVFPVLAGKYASIGNPFASSIDLRKVDTLNLTSTFYVWDPKLTGAYGLGAYQMLYKSGTEYRVMPGGGSYGALNSFVDTLESGQAFFVRAGASAGTLTIKENAKTIGARAMSRMVDGENGFTSNGSQAVYSLLSLVDPGNTTLVDGAMAAYDPAFSNAVDYDDALKMSNTSENVSIKREGTLLAIERRQTITVNDTLFLNITGLRVHQYQWDLILDNMDAPGLTAFLIDKYLATSSPLTLAGTNTVLFDVVNIPGAYAPDRFLIVFKPAAALPVRYSSISAVRNTDKTVAVSWNSENETAMQNYIIERSFDGRNFTAVGTQLPTNNNGGSAAYHFNDATASEGDNYYRVRGNSITGRIDYTSIVKVGPLKQNPGMSIYPNPVTDNTVNLKLTNLPKGTYEMQVINNIGQVILNTTILLQNSNTVKAIQLPASIASGNYRLKVTDAEQKVTTISFMVQ